MYKQKWKPHTNKDIIIIITIIIINIIHNIEAVSL